MARARPSGLHARLAAKYRNGPWKRPHLIRAAARATHHVYRAQLHGFYAMEAFARERVSRRHAAGALVLCNAMRIQAVVHSRKTARSLSTPLSTDSVDGLALRLRFTHRAPRLRAACPSCSCAGP